MWSISYAWIDICHNKTQSFLKSHLGFHDIFSDLSIAWNIWKYFVGYLCINFSSDMEFLKLSKLVISLAKNQHTQEKLTNIVICEYTEWRVGTGNKFKKYTF